MSDLFCYVNIPGNKPGERIGIIKFGESGYYATDVDERISTPQQVKEKVQWLNQRLEIPEDVAESMFAGSMFGWHVPGANRANLWAENHKPMEERSSDIRSSS